MRPDAALDSKRHGHSRQRVINTAAHAQLLIAAAPSRRGGWKKYAGDDLVGRKMQTNNAVVDVEVAERDSPYATRPGNLKLGVETQQRRRRVTGKRCPAEVASGRNVAKIAILLQAEAAALAPQQRLVVPQAARIEADVAAQRGHVANHRRCDRLCRFVQHGIISPNQGRVLDCAERRERADA